MDIFTKEKRSLIMSKIKSKDTKPEQKALRIVRDNFFKKGLRYRRHYKKIIGSPDIAFVGKKIAIFVDGDFWHGYKHKNWIHKLPKKFWQEKITKNIARDKKVNKELKKLGWSVVRIWEHELKNENMVLNKIKDGFKRN